MNHDGLMKNRRTFFENKKKMEHVSLTGKKKMKNWNKHLLWHTTKKKIKGKKRQKVGNNARHTISPEVVYHIPYFQ